MSDAKWLRQNWSEIVALPPTRAAVRFCAVRDCAHEAFAGGLCKPHYRTAQRRFSRAAQPREGLPTDRTSDA